MKTILPGCLTAIASAFLIAGCVNEPAIGEEQDSELIDDDTDGDPDDTSSDQPYHVVTIVAVDGSWKDIDVTFNLDLEDGETRDVVLQYDGGCSSGTWTGAIAGGQLEGLEDGDHLITWYSWEQEAGCSGPTALKIVTNTGESDERDGLELDNTGDHSGFVEIPQEEQGVNDDEADWYAQVVDALVEAPSVDFVATRIGSTYEVHAARGSVYFERTPTNTGYEYDVVEVFGENPIANQDPTQIPTLAQELAYGENPNNATASSLGYDSGDPRLSFIEPANDIYPFGYRRIAAYFDHPDSADVMVNWAGFAHFDTEPGEHGSLNLIQSRSPFVMWGAGVEPGVKEIVARQPDIAPTVARLLGAPITEGVDERGVYSRFVHLKWQDGGVLGEFLDGGVADQVIVIVSDGLTHTELLYRLGMYPESYPNLRRLLDEGAWSTYGSISNWPSVTYPGHNVIGSGIWSGHHGLVDNRYFLREEGELATPISDLLNTGHYFNPVVEQGETLHMALHRAFGNWADDPAGIYTASIFDPSVVGANTADLEFRDDSGLITFPLDSLIPASGVPWPNVPIWETTIWGEQYSEMMGMTELSVLLGSDVSPVPRYVIMNFPTTDGCGHAYGPHGDLMADVLGHIDENVGVLLQWLEGLGVLDTTAIFFTSDHGMQLADPTRSGHPLDALDAAGVSYVAGTGLGLYMPD